MAKDNSTGKDKEFYDLGKKIFDRLNSTEADEAWDELERIQQKSQDEKFRKAVEQKSWQFIVENDLLELGTMSIQKAYEIGYRAGVYAEQRKKDEHPR